MPRKKKDHADNYYKAFPSAMRKLMEQKGITQNELADYIQKTRQAVAYYCDGSSSPDWETIAKIADFFDVSSDYLLGRTQDPSRHPCAADELGLSVEAIAYIRSYSNPARSKEMEELIKPDDCLKGLSMLLENGRLMPLSKAIKYFKESITQSIEVSSIYQKTTPEEAGEDYFKWRHAADEDILITQMQKTLEAEYPTLKGNFEILLGRHRIESQRREITDYFSEMLCEISNYNEYKKVTPEW